MWHRVHTVHFSVNSIIAYWHQFESGKAEECWAWHEDSTPGIGCIQICAMRNPGKLQHVVQLNCNWDFLWFGREHLRLPNAQQRLKQQQLWVHNPCPPLSSLLPLPGKWQLLMQTKQKTTATTAGANNTAWVKTTTPPPPSLLHSPVIGTSLVVNNVKVLEWLLFSFPFPHFPFAYSTLTTSPSFCPLHWQVLSSNCISCDLLAPSRIASNSFPLFATAAIVDCCASHSRRISNSITDASQEQQLPSSTSNWQTEFYRIWTCIV